MEELDTNPFYRALLTKFRREFELACKLSYVVAVPQADCLREANLSQFFVNSHILMPSKLLKQHYTPLQAGHIDDIEIEGDKLICYPVNKAPGSERQPHKGKILINIIDQDIGYNLSHKEYRILIIEQPLVAPVSPRTLLIRSLLMRPLSPRLLGITEPIKLRPRSKLKDHTDCLSYLEHISSNLTRELETDVKRIQSARPELLAPMALEQLASQLDELAGSRLDRFAKCVEMRGGCICDSGLTTIRLAIEDVIVHLLHENLVESLQDRFLDEDTIVAQRLRAISRCRMNVCQLGGQAAFVDFQPGDELVGELLRLPQLRSPLSIITCLNRLVGIITDTLNRSAKFRQLLLGPEASERPTYICSDDLIASLVMSLCHAKPERLFSVAKYLELFSWSSSAGDQAAYYSVTFQSVVQYIFGYQSQAPKLG